MRGPSYSTDEVPKVLESPDLQGIARFIKSDGCKNIFIMAGAGISTSAGIPDFRSPDTGLYANLARLKLPYPEAVFDIGFFKRNPRPFYVLAHELAPGKFRPTPTHSFIRLLSEKGQLHTCFTQNIDTLERVAGVPASKIIEAHGSFADQHCIQCGAHYPHEEIKEKIRTQEIPRCIESNCKGYVKPDIVFFGESLPDDFITNIRNLRHADLLIVMGTSLTVMPFASLTEMVPDDCPRLLLNLDHVGDFGSRVNDVEALMPCDSAVRELCRLLEWEEDLERLWAETVLKIDDAGGKKEGKTAGDEDKVSTVPLVVDGTDNRRAHLDEVVEGIAEKVAAASRELSRESEGTTKTNDDPDVQSEKGRAEAQTQNEREANKIQSLEGKDLVTKAGDDIVDDLANIVKGIDLEDEKQDETKDVESGHNLETGKT